MNVLDLFSGIGGFSLGLERAGMKTVAFCEIEPYPQAVLRKNFPGVPIYDDVRTITAARLRADGIDTVDLVCGGFPCQPFSVAGKQLGKEDHRHLWPEMLRIVQEFNPTWVIGENVAGFVSMALEEVSVDLEAAGYEVQSFVVPACAVDAQHRRDRCWIVAHSTRSDDRRNTGEVQGADEQQAAQRQERRFCTPCNASKIGNVANTPIKRQPRQGQPFISGDTAKNRKRQAGDAIDVCVRSEWPVEPGVGRVANGISDGVDRLKCLGNTVVPQIPEIIGRAIMQMRGLTAPSN